jgi:hypothetical protein
VSFEAKALSLLYSRNSCNSRLHLDGFALDHLAAALALAAGIAFNPLDCRQAFGLRWRHVRNNGITMKTVANWFLVGVFALQATGMVWSAHLDQYCQSQGVARGQACCPCGLCHEALRHTAGPYSFAWKGIFAMGHQPAPAPKPTPIRHDPRNCRICQVLLMLWATAQTPATLVAVNEVPFQQPAPCARPAAHTFLSTLDARGPPAAEL